MKKKFALVGVLLLSQLVMAQYSTFTDGWSLGFGITSPRWMSDASAEFFNFGGHVFVQRDLTEKHSMRGGLSFLSFDASGTDITNNTFSLDLGYTYKFEPCGPFKMYFGMGFGLTYYTLKGVPGEKDKNVFGEISANFVLGSLYRISDEWDLRGEFGQYNLSTDGHDGIKGANGGFFGGVLDTYIALMVGANYYWERGEPSKICDYLPEGMSSGTTVINNSSVDVDYDRIQKMIDDAKSAPAQIDYTRIEEIFNRKIGEMQKSSGDKTPYTYDSRAGEIAFVGINFNINDASILQNNYPILAQVAMALLSNPEIQLEIHGHTDSSGSEQANKILSSKRAENVKNYLVSKGVSASRLSVYSHGSSMPVADNNSEDGRALNRRVDFKVKK